MATDKENIKNEEIESRSDTDDLTKNLEKTNINEHSIEDDVKILENESDSEKDKENCPLDDNVDENILKEIDDTLSDEEKEKRKIEAEELKQKGNEEFKKANYVESVHIYTSALKLCPLAYTNERSILYANRSASKIKLDYKKSALDDCSKALELNPNYIKALTRRAQLHEELDKLDESLEDYKKLQSLDPSNKELTHTIYVLSQKIDKRNEEMKTEMLGKLKDLGNLILKPFGLSTDNFQLNKDENTGGYSVNFLQKK